MDGVRRTWSLSRYRTTRRSRHTTSRIRARASHSTVTVHRRRVSLVRFPIQFTVIRKKKRNPIVVWKFMLELWMANIYFLFFFKILLPSLVDVHVGGSIIVKQIGHAILTVDLPSGEKEEFLITLPRLRIDGLWYGSPYIELTEFSYIQSSSGWLSTVRPPLLSPLLFHPTISFAFLVSKSH